MWVEGPASFLQYDDHIDDHNADDDVQQGRPTAGAAAEGDGRRGRGGEGGEGQGDQHHQSLDDDNEDYD